MTEEAKSLDQFYTKEAVATRTLNLALEHVKKLSYDLSDISFLEPSAGNGSFLAPLRKAGMDYFAYDIAPKESSVEKLDFLKDDISAELAPRGNLIVIGNPPFGKRARLAIEFINKSFEYSDTVIFILPLQFYKFSAQKKINENAQLVYTEKLPEDSFTFMGEDYGVRCCIQIWTLRPSFRDLRITSPPLIRHADFEMWQYNNTRQAEKYFDKDKYQWDFAVPRQGYKDYTIKETMPSKMDRRTQWIFFKANTSQALKNLKKIDFSKLSHKNTTTPGFGKADVVDEYHRLFGDHSSADTSTSIHTFQLGEPRPSLAETFSPVANL